MESQNFEVALRIWTGDLEFFGDCLQFKHCYIGTVMSVTCCFGPWQNNVISVTCCFGPLQNKYWNKNSIYVNWLLDAGASYVSFLIVEQKNKSLSCSIVNIVWRWCVILVNAMMGSIARTLLLFYLIVGKNNIPVNLATGRRTRNSISTKIFKCISPVNIIERTDKDDCYAT